MAEINRTSSTSGEDSRKNTGDICRNIDMLQEGQTQLVNQMNTLALTLNSFLGVQKGLSTIDLFKVPAEGLNAVADKEG